MLCCTVRKTSKWLKVLCLRSEHILSTASTITSELMNRVCYTHLFSSGWIAREVRGINVVTLGTFVFVVFLGIAVRLLCLSTRFYTLCWNVTGSSFLWNVSYHTLLVLSQSVTWLLESGPSTNSVIVCLFIVCLFWKVYSAVFVYICNTSNTNSYLL
jgi:hypothetical protein